MLLSLLDKILRLFGTSEQRVRWKLHIWREQRQAKRRGRRNVARHLTYRHKVCDACGQVVHRDARVCPHCDAPIASWNVKFGGKLLERLLPGQGSMTTALLVANGAVFFVSVFYTGEIWGFAGPTGINYGVNYGPLMTGGGEWWRLFSYNFIHVGGAIHIGFNLYALAVIGPMVEEWYGSARATVIFVATGAYAGVASHLYHPMALSGGASGAVLGLLGAGVVAGHLDGSTMGKQMRNSLFKWFAFIVLVGLVMPGIDNAAHVGGFVSGAVIGAGFGVIKSLGTRERWVFRGLAAVGVAVCVASMILSFWNGRDLPTHMDETTMMRLWRDCVRTAREEPAAEAAAVCDLAGRSTMYMDPFTTTLAASLYRSTGESDRAMRLLAIQEATHGIAYTGTETPEQILQYMHAEDRF